MEMDKLVALCRRRRVFVSVERNLRRAQRLLGLWPARCRAEAEYQRGLVARHGHRAQRTCEGARAPSTYEMVGLDATIIMHPQVWKCSGHYDLFCDMMVDCRQTKNRYRFDQVRGRWAEYQGQKGFVTTLAENESEDIAAARSEALQAAGQGCGQDHLGRRYHVARQGRRFEQGPRARGQ